MDNTWIFTVIGLLQSLAIVAGQSPDCIGVFIFAQCHVFRFDGKNWADSEKTCADYYTIDGFGGTFAAHLTTISSPDKQFEMVQFFKRFAINTAWVGATNKPLYWQWKASSRIIQTQGCYRDDGKDLSLPVSGTNFSIEACIDACVRNGFGFAGMQGGWRCACGNTLTAENLAVGGGCTTPCSVPSGLSDWCGGPGLNSVYKIGGSNARWGYNQPSNAFTGQRSCGVLDTQLDSNLKDEDCTSTFDFLCQLNNSAACTTGSSNTRLLSTTCYYISSGQQQSALSWADASARCQGLGGELASVDNRNLQLAIAAWFKELFPAGQSKRIWVGAYKGGWYWIAGYSFEYTNWAPGHPIQSDRPLCLRVNAGLNYQWESAPCEDRNYFICQRGYDQTTTPSNIWVGTTLYPGTGGGGQGGNGGNVGNWTYANFTVPDSGGSTANSGRLSDLAIGLLAALGSLLFLLGLVGLICCILCCCAKRNGAKKVDCERWHDARPIAHVPNGGEEFASTITLSNKAPYPS